MKVVLLTKSNLKKLRKTISQNKLEKINLNKRKITLEERVHSDQTELLFKLNLSLKLMSKRENKIES
jgi:hypothetical protein